VARAQERAIRQGLGPQLVETVTPRLIWSICRRYRLDSADAEDVGQGRLVHAGGPPWITCAISAALPGWAGHHDHGRECGRVLPTPRAGGARGEQVLIAAKPPGPPRPPQSSKKLLVAEQAGRSAWTPFARLPPRLPANCSPCSSQTLRSRMPRSVRGWASRAGKHRGPVADGCLDRLSRGPGPSLPWSNTEGREPRQV